MINELENIILRKIKNDDHQAFRYIYKKYYQHLFLFARKFVRQELATDFVQDCFYDFWVNWKKIEIRTSLQAYLFAVLKNRCYKFYQPFVLIV